MAQPSLEYEDIKAKLDEVITADGDPYADAVAVIAHTLELALGPANGGMGEAEWQGLMSVAFTLVGADSGVRIAMTRRGK